MVDYKSIVERILDDREAYLYEAISEGMANGKQVSAFTKSKNSGLSQRATGLWLNIFEVYDWYWNKLNEDIRGTNLLVRYASRDLGFYPKDRNILKSMLRYIEEGNNPYSDPEIKAMINGGNSFELHEHLTPSHR